jgi:hypothetical protein
VNDKSLAEDLDFYQLRSVIINADIRSLNLSRSVVSVVVVPDIVIHTSMFNLLTGYDRL